MAERKFKFRNMGQYVLNVIDPRLKALQNLFISSDERLEKKVNEALLAMSQDMEARLTAMQTYIDGLVTVPVGFMVPWPSKNNPSDWPKWLEADGKQPVSQALYPELYALVGPVTPNGYERMLYGGAPEKAGTVVDNAVDKARINIRVNDSDSTGSLTMHQNGTLAGGGGSGYVNVTFTGFSGVPIPPYLSVRWLIRALR